VLAGGVIAAEAAVVVLLVPPGSTWLGFVLAGLLAVAFAAAGILPMMSVVAGAARHAEGNSLPRTVARHSVQRRRVRG
jgi:hypothetical protein